MKKVALLLLLAVTGILIAGWWWPSMPEKTPRHSDLWGSRGDAWNKAGWLGDFSFAGYRMGDRDKPIPDLPVVADVRDFGAAGDGITDDTDAFRLAIASAEKGAVFVPAGRYLLSGVLRLDRSGMALRGAGSGRTTLYVPKPLSEVLDPAPRALGRDGHWSWGGGFIWLSGGENGRRVTEVVEPAVRGDHILTVQSTAGLASADIIRIVLSEADDGSLWQALHGGPVESGADAIAHVEGNLADFVSRVTVIDDDTLRLERPLPFDVRLPWSPAVHEYRPSIEDVGVEDLSLEFEPATYGGHLTEAGYNGIYVDDLHHFWIRGVEILNADSGIMVRGGSRFGTLSDIRLANDDRTGHITGHHGISVEGPDDLLITDFRIDTRFRHDLTVDMFSMGNVFSKGRGVDLCFDHHRGAPHDNLFSDIDIGKGTRPWDHGGSPSGYGPASGLRETFWNIRSQREIRHPLYPAMVVVGVHAGEGFPADGHWYEEIDPNQLIPQDIHLAQRARRWRCADIGKQRGGNACRP